MKILIYLIKLTPIKQRRSSRRIPPNPEHH